MALLSSRKHFFLQAREKDAAVAKEKVVQEEALRRMYKELKKSRETIESLKREVPFSLSDITTA